MKRLAVISIVLAALATSFLAQSPQEDALGCATDKSRTLGFLVGEWNVRSNFRINKAQSKWEKSEAVSKITHLFEDCVYQEILTGTRNGRPYQFTGLFSYNNMSDKLQWVGGHSEHGVLTLYEGDFVDGELILENQLMLRSNLVYFRIVITKTKDGFDVRSERSADKKLWDAGWYMSYTRRG
ncbi:MAG: hypothetical protein OEM82_02155 [Acidobacteriota bacterium]|nr:hypothetical protein [Acidobacteriota bacterium]MDH3529784.1 hypothetical protein [Acidobacteriota bacterium]